MKKYYISTIIGDGTEENAFRSKIEDYPYQEGRKIWRTSEAGDGWCLCSVDVDDHSLWADDPGIQELEEF